MYIDRENNLPGSCLGLHVVNGLGQGSAFPGSGFPGLHVPRLLGGGVLAANRNETKLRKIN